MRAIRVLLVAATLTGLVAPPALASESAARPRAEGSWSMVPQSRDANGDGIIDGDGGVPKSGATSLTPSRQFVGAGNHVAQPHERLIDGALSWYLSPRGYPVRLDACRSQGTDARWVIRQGGKAVTTTTWTRLATACRTTVFLPEATYQARLEVRDGSRTSSTTLPMPVRNILMVVLGDSYASGEGNPRNVQAWLRRGGALDPYWDDVACDRSARGAPALAALTLEKSSPHTSVTLVDVACSGATVAQGVLGPYPGAGQATSQIEQAARIVGSRPVDLVVLSVGGNDVGFTSILQTCALNADCPLATPAPGPLAAFPSVQQGVQSLTGALGASYTAVAACLGGGTCTLADGRSTSALQLAPGGRVLPTLYPDITRAEGGQPCSYLSIPAADFAWARATILDPAPPATYAYPLAGGGTASLPVAQGSLNEQVTASGRLPAWRPVTGTWTSWADTPQGHGVCAGRAAWVFGYTGLSGFTSASFHPNPTGQRVLGRAIAESAAAAVGEPVGS